MLYNVPDLLSCLNCTIAYGSSDLLGLVRPTGFIGPNLNVSSPLLMISSMGMQPSKKGVSSKFLKSILGAFLTFSINL